jgi:hypothetical protein
MAGELTPDWLERQCEGAPAELVARATAFVRSGSGGEATSPEALARAGAIALTTAIERADERRSALDLLAADALVTLALAAAVERDPIGLEAFASSLLGADR